MSTRDALRMLRSCPALSLNAVATGTGTPAVHLKLAVRQLKGRGRCDEIASSSTSWGSGYPRKRSMILDTGACPPFAVRRATWDQSGAVRANIPGAAGWSTRSTKKDTAPRVAYAKAAADPATSFGAVQPGCPPAIATRLTTTGDPFTTEASRGDHLASGGARRVGHRPRQQHPQRRGQPLGSAASAGSRHRSGAFGQTQRHAAGNSPPLTPP